MFTPNEIDQLKRDLGLAIKATQAQIDKNDASGDNRLTLEEKLINQVSAYNKLEHLKPEKKNDHAQIRALVIDDVESMLKVHAQYMKDCGFRNIEVATDGLQAYAKLKKAMTNQKPFHLVISDWEMPKASGLELLRKVRTDKDLWHIPFYLITSHNGKEHILQAINSGATGYLVKPINQKMVNNKFRTYLEQQ